MHLDSSVIGSEAPPMPVAGDTSVADRSPYPMEGDGVNVRGLRQGDRAAFERLVRETTPRLLAVARRILGNEEDARDAVQETFLNAIRSIEGFREASQLSTWLHRIVVNVSLMKLRSAGRRPEQPLDLVGESFDETGHRIGPWQPLRFDPEQMVLDEEARRLVRRCIDRLPDRFREVLLLRDIEELDTAETARLLGVSENAVKIRLHRARQSLMKALQEPPARGIA